MRIVGFSFRNNNSKVATMHSASNPRLGWCMGQVRAGFQGRDGAHGMSEPAFEASSAQHVGDKVALKPQKRPNRDQVNAQSQRARPL